MDTDAFPPCLGGGVGYGEEKPLITLMDTDTFPPCLGGGEVRMGVDLMYGMYEMNSQIFAACWISENQWNQWFNSGGEEPLMNTDTCPLCLGGGDLGYGEKKPLITLMPFRRAWVKAI